jgi:hypothetical protein
VLQHVRRQVHDRQRVALEHFTQQDVCVCLIGAGQDLFRFEGHLFELDDHPRVLTRGQQLDETVCARLDTFGGAIWPSQ